MDVPPIVVAGRNPAKAAALKRVAAPIAQRCIRRLQVDVDESGQSFAENARTKAESASRSAPGTLALASDGGLLIPALGARWDPLRTARFAPDSSPEAKARRLLDLVGELRGDARTAYWTEAFAVAHDGRTLEVWTERGPRCRIAESPREPIGHFWVEALLWACDPGPSHWELLAVRFEDFCRRRGYVP